MKAALALLLAAALSAGFLAGAVWSQGQSIGPLALLAAALSAACLGLALLALAQAERARNRAQVAEAAERLALSAALKAEVDGYKRTLDRRAGNIRALVEARSRAGDSDPAFEVTPQLADILTLPPPAVFPANLQRLHLLAPDAVSNLIRFYRLVEDARASLDIRRRNWRKRAEVFEDLSRVAESASQSLSS